MHKIEARGLLLFVGGVGNFARHTGIQPEVNQVGAKSGNKDRSDNGGAYAVLIGGRYRFTAGNRPYW